MPCCTIIPGEEDAAFRAGIEQPFALLVFAHCVDERVRGKTMMMLSRSAEVRVLKI